VPIQVSPGQCRSGEYPIARSQNLDCELGPHSLTGHAASTCPTRGSASANPSAAEPACSVNCESAREADIAARGPPSF